MQECDTIIYYWPKDKSEAKFQLMNLISYLKIDSEIFIVGNKTSGIKSSISIFKKWIQLKKIDNARHSILISGFLKRRKKFVLEEFYKTHIWKNLFIKSLPGVFGHKKIDEGSKLLASTFSYSIKGSVLDVGCGTGFLSISILYFSPDAKVSLVDNDLAALQCSKLTLDANNLKGEIIYSNLYSNIFEKFDLIISNPPFHDDLKITFEIIKKIIFNAKKYLKSTGKLRFVTNRCFNYHFFLKENFKKYSILATTKTHKVYEASLK
ncbi:class I SAM-dependent methyltransferase [Buchnera aphidicola]|uniref:class I SAM-dependent methyltransferase n=1 Tax=Buchnera aphidicola TaxID=9 RepID=UPI0021C5A358|nr:class I SAM-dependent methyltransferase [Buchnera aphidicola]